MRVLGVLVAWGVLAVLATMCFALGGSIGYRRGVRDTLAQIRERRTGKTGCRPFPLNHLRRRTSGHARPGARARRARWHVGQPSAAGRAAWLDPERFGRVPTVAAASLAVVLLLGVPGTAIGATTAQPGDSLWKVKLGLEQVRLALSTSPESDAGVHVALASARLTELAGLVGDDAAPNIVDDVSADLSGHARAASDVLDRVQTTAVRADLERRIVDLTAQQVVVMDLLLETDCRQGADRDCAALTATRDDMVALRESTDDAVAMIDAVATEVATPVPSPPTSVVQAEILPTVPADRENTAPAAAAERSDTGEAAPEATGGSSGAGASTTAPQAATSSTPKPTPKPKPKPSPTPAPTPKPSPTPAAATAPTNAGSPATEPAVAPTPAKKSGGTGDVQNDDAAAAAASNAKAD